MTKRGVRQPVGLAWLSLLAAAVALAAACSRLDVQTFQNPDIPIPGAATYAWKSAPLGGQRQAELDPRVHNALVSERIREAIESVLASKGFRRGGAETADFLVEYRVGVWSKERAAVSLNLDPPDAARDASPGASPGSAYGAPPSVETHWAEGTEGGLLITLYERATGRIAYRALGRDDNVTKRDASERAIASTVSRLLKDLP
jgi:hypothetical protein